MVPPRLSTGQSDPVSYTCTCDDAGIVLLFYRYFANSPSLEPDHALISQDRVEELAQWHRSITTRLAITGKIRVATEGFNITVGGSKTSINEYIATCVKHWSFAGLALSLIERKAFFKPTPGCACVFLPATEAAIQVCAEITPLGITNYTPRPETWEKVEELLPADFHKRCHKDVELLDLRNHYESRIGYFTNGQGIAAKRPQFRRFSQVPKFIKLHKPEKQVLTYCTGGIRCEKVARWMTEQGADVCTLKGGIVAYLDWVKEQIVAGRMSVDESLFKGRNYVFDGRGSMGNGGKIVSNCHVCGKEEDRLSKCRSERCHLVLVVCEGCEGASCCSSCPQKGMCDCERQREDDLWGTKSQIAVKQSN